MTLQEQEIQQKQHKIAGNIKELFENNMSVFDMDIPENDHRASAIEIHRVMQETLDILKKEIDKGTYDQF
ncbi:hypothetical protein [Sulfurovum sp. TSL1]|uniref:hypothetical protein n=1 Tax=Sulfurovum sp. TSL1 TaxID=2826994 RepID=UPI001CC36AD8|nr:hypothetical protein [Sulfurovum sp. TSL1]GIT99492.1 hypothetical protein TSL1_23130 [Sulfurovum sp. TSL1]